MRTGRVLDVGSVFSCNGVKLERRVNEHKLYMMWLKKER